MYYGYRDGAVLIGASGLGTSGICIAQVGSELTSAPTPDFYSDTFDQTPLEWADGSGWHVGWNISQYWVDYPCNQGQVPPYCLNGLYYGANQ